MSRKIKYSEVIAIAIADILVTENYRQSKSENTIEGLAASFKMVGLINPITLVKGKKGKYELVAGGRRLQAHILNEATHIDARVVSGNADVITDIQLIENIQREEVHFIEEAKRLQDKAKSTPVPDIAAAIGVSEQYVYDRIHFAKLHASIRKLALNNEITFSHCLQFCRLIPMDQLAALERIRFTLPGEEGAEPVYIYGTVRELRKIIDREFITDLSNAIFDTVDAKLIARVPACVACKFRSGYNKNLFNDIEAGDICFNKQCFQLKHKQHLFNIEEKLTGEGYEVMRVTTNYSLVKDHDYENVVFMDEVGKVVPEKDFDKVQSTKIGLIFTSQDGAKVGKVVKFYEDQGPRELPRQELPEIDPDLIQAKNMSGIRKKNALVAYNNKIGSALTDYIGSRELDSLPLPIAKICCYNLIRILDDAHVLDIILFFKWTFNGEKVGEEDILDLNKQLIMFTQNTARYSPADWYNLICLLIVYDTIQKGETDSIEFQYMVELLEGFGIDHAAILTSVEKSFNVKL